MNNDGLAPVHIAILQNKRDALAVLLRNGAAVDLPSLCDRMTPLIYASKMGKLELLEVVTQYMCSRRKRVIDNPLAADTSVLMETINAMERYCGGRKNVKLPIGNKQDGWRGFAAVLEHLMKLGAGPIARTPCDDTPMHYLARLKNLSGGNQLALADYVRFCKKRFPGHDVHGPC